MLSIFLGLLVGAVVLMIAGFNPLSAYGLMFKGMAGSPKNIAWTIVQATPLILTGLSVAFAFRTGLFNIGAEGQFIIGALAATLVGYFVHLPAIVHIPITFLAGVFAAGLWASIAGFLKAKFGVHEVIATIMLNWIALYLNNYFIESPSFRRPLSESSHKIQETASITIGWLKGIIGPSTKVNWGIFIALAAAFLIHYILFKTTLGYQLRAVGFNSDAAEYGGINVNKSIITSMLIAGMLAGAAGALHVMGVSHQVTILAAMEGYGFNGIAVSLIGNNAPIACIFSALLFGGLTYGGRAMQQIRIPTEIIDIVIGSIIFFIAAYQMTRLIFIRRMTKKDKGGSVHD